MIDLAVFVMGWNSEGNDKLANKLLTWGTVPNVFTRCDFNSSEAQNYNYCMKRAEELGFKYICITDSDVHFEYPETIPKMYEFISTHPEAGSIRPWRQGEIAIPFAGIEPKYVEDSTAMMWRLNVGDYWDEEFLFTGWVDLDWGLKLERLGLVNYNDRRYPVLHDMKGSYSHAQRPTLQAIKKRNKLILDFKWYLVGIDNWHGVQVYNESAPVEKRIPTINQVVSWTPEECETFQQSISPEHHIIWQQNGRENPNLVWKSPLVVGYSTRKEFERSHGYS